MTTEGQIEPRIPGTVSIQQPIDLVPAKQELASEGARVEVPVPYASGPGAGARDSAIARIPVEIDVAVPIHRFRIGNLLTLAAGQVIATEWPEGEDLPLGARGAQLAWTEFEVIDQKLAVRITRLA